MGKQNSAFAVILHRARVLLVKPRHKSHWTLPGGRLRSVETPFQGLLREVFEETGLRIRSTRLTGAYRRKDGSRAYVYATRVSSPRELAGPNREIRKQRWVRIGNAARFLSTRGCRRLWGALRRSAGVRRHAGSTG